MRLINTRLGYVTSVATALAVLAGLPAAAFAADEGMIEEVVVTGSRIRADLSGANPVTVISNDYIRASGATSIGDILQDLTVQSNGINVQANNGGNGQTRVDLRGLGTPRTLVLVNGRRHVLGAQGSTWAVDLNSLPPAIIESIEVLKDGASAIYGSDAIAGVVNIITRSDFEGVEFNAFAGRSAESDGEIEDWTLTIGTSDDRSSFLISAGYYNQLEVMAGDRGFSFFDKSYDWDANNGSFTPSGSSATPQGTIIDRLGDAGNAAWQAVVNGGCPSGVCYNDATAGWRDMSFAGTSDVGSGDTYNYQPENYLFTPQERWNIYAQGSYSFSDNLTAFAEASYINRQSDQLLAPTPIFIISEGISIDAANIYNPFGRDFIDVRRRMVEAGNRNFLQDIDTYRAVVGVKGNLDLGALEGWSWDAFVSYGRTAGTDRNEGRFVRSRVINAIGPSYVDGEGNIQCGVPGAPIAGCVPLDLLGGLEGRPITADQLNYISYVGVAELFAEQKVFGINLTGPLFELPAGEVGFAVGYENRREEGRNTPDPITASGDTTGNKEEPTEGGYEVDDLYLEFAVPVLDTVNASLAVRWSDYSNFGNTTNGKLGITWDITDQLAIRGTLSEAFRAPSIPDAFLGKSDDFPNVTDPCDTSQGARTGVQQTNCSADGLPDDYEDNRTQLRSFRGGNPNLGPETADIRTVGVVYQPEWLDGLAMTLDWWDVEIEDSIQRVTASVILNSCYNSTSRAYCDKITRAPTGFLTVIDDSNFNIGGVESNGVDFSLTYDQPTGDWGQFRYSLDVAYMRDHTEIQADGTRVQGVGVYDLGVYPEYKINGNVMWSRGDWDAALSFRWSDEFKECEDDDCSGTNTSRTIDSNLIVDLQGSYRFELGGNNTITLGVQNLFDEDPPKIFNGFLATSDTDFEFMGRYFYARYTYAR